MKQLNANEERIIYDFISQQNNKKIIPIYIGIDV